MGLDIDWSLFKPVADIGGNFQRGWQMGEQIVQKQRLKNALADYAADPANPAVQNALAQASPEYALELGQYRAGEPEREAARQEKAAERQRQNVIMGGRILRQIKPTDQASYDRARQMATQIGVDLTSVPEQFDPQYVAQIVQTADALDPQKAEANPYEVRTIEQGGGLFRVNKITGETETLVAPNDGSQPFGAPVAPQALTPGAVVPDPRKQGGPTPQASGGFQP